MRFYQNRMKHHKRKFEIHDKFFFLFFTFHFVKKVQNVELQKTKKKQRNIFKFVFKVLLASLGDALKDKGKK